MDFTAATRRGGPDRRGLRGTFLGALRGAALVGAAGLAALAAGTGAKAAETQAGLTVEAAEFIVSVSDGEGSQRSIQSDLVPYLPDRACFGWRIRLAAAPPVIRFREVLKLPAAPAFWSGEDDVYSPHSFSADRTTAITEEFAAPRDGWIASNWCIADGDPTGKHSIEVFIEGRLIQHFDFEVKKLGQAAGN